MIKTPKNFDWPQSGAVAEVWLTAYQILAKVGVGIGNCTKKQTRKVYVSCFYLAHIKPGQSVLVHAAASGVGTAAVQLITKLFQGTAYGTAGSDDKIKFVESLGATKVFNYKQGDFVEKVLSATGG